MTPEKSQEEFQLSEFPELYRLELLYVFAMPDRERGDSVREPQEGRGLLLEDGVARRSWLGIRFDEKPQR